MFLVGLVKIMCMSDNRTNKKPKATFTFDAPKSCSECLLMFPLAGNLEYICGADIESRKVISTFSDYDNDILDYSMSRAPFCPLKIAGVVIT